MGPFLSWFPAKMAGEEGILILISADQKNPLADQNMWGKDKTLYLCVCFICSVLLLLLLSLFTPAIYQSL